MSRWTKTLMIVVVAATLIAVPAAAGENAKKCTGTTQDCLDYMAKHMRERGWVGVEMEESDHGYQRIVRVVDDSPAQHAGVHSGDVLVAINGHDLADADQSTWKELKGSMKPGSTLTYTVERSGARKDIAVTLAPVPDAVLAQWVGRHMLDHATVEVAAK